jgi:GAF domain-containing protein
MNSKAVILRPAKIGDYSPFRSSTQSLEELREKNANIRLRIWFDRLYSAAFGLSHDAALELALDAAISVTGAQYANIQLMDLNREVLEIKAQRGFKQSFLDFFEFVDDASTACGVALLQRRPVIVEDVCFSPVFSENKVLEVVLDSGIRSVESAPLVTDTKMLLGIISVHHSRPQFFSENDILRFQAVAAAIANLIH